MTVIYVDTLFLLNAMVDYLLLLAAARLAGEPLARLRFLLGALLGGGYAVAIFLPGLAFLRHPLCRGAAAVLMLLAAYGGSRRLVRQGVIFLALSCAFAGGVLAVGLMGGQGLALGRSGVIYSPLDLKLVLLSAAGCYGALTMAFSRVGAAHRCLRGAAAGAADHRGADGGAGGPGRHGEHPHRPGIGPPVMVAEGDRLTALFPKECRPERDDLEDPASGLVRLGRGAWRGRFSLLPYRAVGVSRGLLLAVRVDQIQLAGENKGPLLVALSPTPVSDGGGYGALIAPL